MGFYVPLIFSNAQFLPNPFYNYEQLASPIKSSQQQCLKGCQQISTLQQHRTAGDDSRLGDNEDDLLCQIYLFYKFI